MLIHGILWVEVLSIIENIEVNKNKWQTLKRYTGGTPFQKIKKPIKNRTSRSTDITQQIYNSNLSFIEF